MYSSDHVRCFIAYYSKLGQCFFLHTLFIIFNVIMWFQQMYDVNDTLKKKTIGYLSKSIGLAYCAVLKDLAYLSREEQLIRFNVKFC